MWVQKTRQGTYQFCERYKTKTGEVKKVSVTLKSNNKSAHAKAVFELQKKLNMIRFGTCAKDIAFGELCDRYIGYEEREFKEQTAVNADRHLSRVRKLIGDEMPVSQITPNFLRSTLDTGAPSLFNGRMKFVKSMMRWAYEAELIEDCSCVERVKNRKDVKKKEKLSVKFMEKKELKKLLDAMKQEQWKLLTEFLALTGMRIGEAMALRKTDVDEENKTIHVERTYSLTINKMSSTKTDASCREIHMQPQLVECCQKVKKYHRGVRGQLVFRSEKGPISYPAYKKYLAENTEKIIGKRLTPHALRHTHVALLAEAGMPIEAISHRLGHADSKITQNVYYHVTNVVKDRENSLMDGISLL